MNIVGTLFLIYLALPLIYSDAQVSRSMILMVSEAAPGPRPVAIIDPTTDQLAGAGRKVGQCQGLLS